MIVKSSLRRPCGFLALSLALALLASLLLATTAYADPIVGNTATSNGAGSEMTGDKAYFKNKLKGIFIKMRADDGDFEVQTKQGRIKKGSKKVYNTAVAVKVNQEDDRVIYDAKTKLFTLNGEQLDIDENSSLPISDDGSKVEKKPGGIYTITSAEDDQVTLTVFGKYVNLSIEAGPGRQGGEMKGSLGQFDSDDRPENDLVDSDETPVDSAGSLASRDVSAMLTEQLLKIFLEGWSLADLLSSLFAPR